MSQRCKRRARGSRSGAFVAGRNGIPGAAYASEALERRMLLSFNPLGTEFQVNQTTALSQGEPAVAVDGDGDFVVAWQSNGNSSLGPNQDPSGYGIYARRFDAAGTPLGGEFRVNSYTPNDQKDPAVAMDADGDFVVAWASVGEDGSGYGLYAQRYDAAGNRQGSEIHVSTHAAGTQRRAAVAMDVAGDFVIAWESYAQDNPSPFFPNTYGVYAKRYNAQGVEQPAGQITPSAEGNEFRV